MVTSAVHKSWDLVLSGLLRCVYQTSFLEKNHKFIMPQYFFEGESDPKVKAVKKMFDLVLDIYRERRHKALLGSVVSFEQEVLKFSDGEILDECMFILQRFRNDDRLIEMATNEQCEVQFLDYLKMVKIREWSQGFGKHWKENNMHETQKCVDDLAANLKLLNKRDVLELDTKNITALLENINTNSYKNFRIGIPSLDGKSGWYEPQTLNLFGAPSGRGKSMMANTIIRLAIKQGKYVNVTVVENRVHNFITRAMAALTGIPINVLKDGYSELSGELQRRVKKCAELMDKYVTVSFMYGQSIEEVHAHKVEQANLRKYNKLPKFDIDIVDYTGHVVAYSGSNQDQMHTRFRNAYSARKDFALKNDVICFDFVQINREGTKKNDLGGSVIGMNDLASSFDLAQVADTIITINQGPNDQAVEEAKFYIAKGREGGQGKEITVRTMFNRGRFATNYDSSNPELVVSEGLDEEVIGKTQSIAAAEEEKSNLVSFSRAENHD
ncbi:phage_DnaB, phage replicative helicase, DnaB family [uncultured Caudovirales phage]|uniref:Phage_DnaB, phage replicative helicase, DnaB family n=1 Tax=uncultured Caudovirales phage TaxID=2100421 RepID=A0A6J7WVM9_9CAUD|nr:phage_DnaB, phage replicative helicase, DnaB family [uncultured Caudovirales phage]